MSNQSDQLHLVLPHKPQTVDIEAIRRQPSMTKAIVLCADLGGFVNDKDLCRAMDVDPAVWARIKSSQANFPHDKLNDFMDQAGNEVPLIWLADRRGYFLQQKETETQRALRKSEEARVRAEEENRILRSILTGKVA